MTIQSVLEELHDQILFSYQNIKDNKLYDKDAKARLSQATAKLKALMLECLPKRKEEKPVNAFAGGYNQALTDIRAKVGEL